MMSITDSSTLYMKPFTKELNSHEYKEFIFSTMEKLWRFGLSCDLIIEAEGVEFRCHRILLVCLSKYFSCIDKYRREYAGDEAIMRLKLPFINADGVDSVLQYVYTGHITAQKENLASLIYTADYFLFESMLESISKMLKKYLSIDNVIDYYKLAHQINNGLILSVSLKFIIRNVYQLHKREKQFHSLSLNTMINIIRDKRLIIREKSILYFGSSFKNCLREIISAWVIYDLENRKEFDAVLRDCFENQFPRDFSEKLKLETYRYIEPIPRAYFLNSNPFGQHPPYLVYPPFNFRCLGRNIRRTFIDHPPHKWFVKKIIIYIIPDWNNVAAIADIQIDYKHYWTGEIQSFRAIIDNYCAYIKEEINLEDNERILQLDIFHGWLVYGIKLYTNNGYVFGLYGSDNGELTKINFQKEYSNSMYLHGFAFISTYTKEWHAINWLTVYGSMINKDIYYQDFQVSFEEDIECRIVQNKSTESDCRIIDRISMAQLEPEIYLQDISYPLPETIEDLFYQWRRCMRMMRLSVIRRNNSIISFRERDLIFPFTIPGLSIQNISSPDFTDRDFARDV